MTARLSLHRPWHRAMLLGAGLGLATAASGPGCTRVKPVTEAATPPVAAASPDDQGSGVATFPSEPPPSPPPEPSPTPQPTLRLLQPTAATDLTATGVTISFSALPPSGRTLSSARVRVNGELLGSLEGPGPTFTLPNWDPNQVNNLAKEPKAQALKAGELTLTLEATDSAGATTTLDVRLRKPLKILQWKELAPMLGPTSHFALVHDAAVPPAYFALWGSVDGVDTVMVPRTKVLGFNPAGFGAWTEVTMNGATQPRASYGVAKDPSGQRVYMVGGRVGAQDVPTVDVVAPLQKTGEPSTVRLNVPRRDPAAVVHDGHLYVVGGASNGTPLYSVERVKLGARDLLPQTAFESLADTLNARVGANAAVVNQEIWLFGGGFRPIEAFDPKTGRWRFVPGPNGETMATPEAFSFSAMVPVGDSLFFFGGTKEDGQPVTRIYEFIPGALAWRDVGPLPELPGVPAEERAETRMGAFFLDGAFVLAGGLSLPEKRPTARVFRAETL